MKNSKKSMNRRHFITRMAGAGAATLAFPFIAPKSWAANNGPALRVAVIGVGGIGGRHTGNIERLGAVCPCYADVDTRRTDNVTSRWPDAAGFQDYRKMFDTMRSEFDAVMVATPDHHHYPATVLALQHGKHCFTEKPLTHTIGEARRLTELAAGKQLATQMGNQGHANLGNRMTYSWVKSGAIGEILETHCWTNRPVWPQGMERPKGEAPVPAELDWDVWVGPAPMRSFIHTGNKENEEQERGIYHPFNWRGWWDFGGGALGDMACHTMDGLYWTLFPRQPESIEMVKTTGFNGEAFPTESIIRLNFPAAEGARGFPLYWYSGGLKPERTEELSEGQQLPNSGFLIRGTKATILATGDYGESPRIIPDEKRIEIGRPELLVEPSPGHPEEWFMACRGEKPWDFPESRFSYAGPFTEVVNLGVLAHQLEEGEKAHWDSENLRVTDRTDLNRFVNKEYREGWDLG